MFVLDNFPKNSEDVLLEIIRITCEAQNDKEPKKALQRHQRMPVSKSQSIFTGTT